MKPIVKWPGGKTQCLSYIRDRLPPSFVDQKYYEPFLGGGAVLLDLFELKPTKAVVSDINPELINMYTQIRDNVSKVVTELTKLDICHESYSDPKVFYYDVRQDFNKYLGSNTPTQAARFIYLNKHCFNGLYRVNSKGEFNVPFNGKKTGGSFDAEHLIKAAVRLKDTTLLCCDFEDTVKDAKEFDLVYFDPPYDYEHEDGFVGYTGGGWTRKDTTRLKLLCDQLVDRGCYIILSNNSTTFIKELFNDDRYLIEEIPARRAINSKGTGRGPVPEVIIRSKNCI